MRGMRPHPSARRAETQTGATAATPESAAEPLAVGWRLRLSEVSVPPAPGVSKAVLAGGCQSPGRKTRDRKKKQSRIRQHREREQEAGGLF